MMPLDKKTLVCEDGYKLAGDNCITMFIDHSSDSNDHVIDSCMSTAVMGPNTVTCHHPAKPSADE